jgi:hypothetical protein
MKRLFHNVKVAIVSATAVFVVAGGFTWIGFRNHYDPTGLDSGGDAQSAYQTAVYQAAQHDHRFLPAAEVAAQIERKHVKFDARVGSKTEAVNYLLHHYGYYGTLFVVPSDDPTHIQIVARHKADAVDVLVGDTRGKTHDQVFSVRHWKSHPFIEVESILGGSLFGVALLIACLSALSGASGSERERERWAELVPADYAYGPAEPEEGFSLMNPRCIDHLGEPWFTAEPYTYRHGYWQRNYQGEDTKTITNPDGSKVEKVCRAGCWQPYTPLPKELTAIRVDPDAAPAEVAERWVEFCAAVGSWNARCWQQRQDQELRLAHAKELSRTPVKELLQPGSKVLAGLAVEPTSTPR